MRRKVKKIGNSLGIIVPRDIAGMMEISDGSEVDLKLVGRSLVAEPTDEDIPDPTFRRALATVLRRRASDFEYLAAFDAGRSG